MDLVKLYTISKIQGMKEGPGGYATLIIYIDSKGKKHEKALAEGEVCISKTRLSLKGIVDGINILNRHCKIEIYTDCNFIIDAIRYNWVGKWVENNWKRRGFSDVKNVDLWIDLINKMQKHEMIFKKIDMNHMTEEMIRCEKMANETMGTAAFVDNITV